jgi:hypothetical protein
VLGSRYPYTGFGATCQSDLPTENATA